MVQLQALGERMDANFKRIEGQIADMEKRMREGEVSAPVTRQRVDAIDHKVEQNCGEIEALEKAVTELKQAITELRQSNKIMTWLGGCAGGALVLWVISQLLALI